MPVDTADVARVATEPGELPETMAAWVIRAERFGKPRDAFQKNVPVGEQSDQQAVHEVPLADEHALDRPVERVQPRPQLLDGRRVGHELEST